MCKSAHVGTVTASVSASRRYCSERQLYGTLPCISTLKKCSVFCTLTLYFVRLWNSDIILLAIYALELLHVHTEINEGMDNPGLDNRGWTIHVLAIPHFTLCTWTYTLDFGDKTIKTRMR